VLKKVFERLKTISYSLISTKLAKKLKKTNFALTYVRGRRSFGFTQLLLYFWRFGERHELWPDPNRKVGPQP
jgi:hypothetical protein